MSKKRNRSFENRALEILQNNLEFEDVLLGDKVLEAIRRAHQLRPYCMSHQLRHIINPLSNPDGLFIQGNRVVSTEMKATSRSLGRKTTRTQLTNEPHYVSAVLEELRRNSSWQQELGLTLEESLRLMEVVYEPEDPTSNWLVFGKIGANDEKFYTDGFIPFQEPNLQIPPQFEGPSKYIPVYIGDYGYPEFPELAISQNLEI